MPHADASFIRQEQGVAIVKIKRSMVYVRYLSVKRPPLLYNEDMKVPRLDMVLATTASVARTHARGRTSGLAHSYTHLAILSPTSNHLANELSCRLAAPVFRKASYAALPVFAAGSDDVFAGAAAPEVALSMIEPAPPSPPPIRLEAPLNRPWAWPPWIRPRDRPTAPARHLAKRIVGNLCVCGGRVGGETVEEERQRREKRTNQRGGGRREAHPATISML